MRFVLAAVLLGLASCSGAPAAPVVDASPPAADAASTEAAPWRKQVLYLAIVDRFFDGDEGNNRASGCFEPGDTWKYHGGDLAGLESRLDYLQELGVTTLWTTPLYQQSVCGGFHGYWPAYGEEPAIGVQAELGGADAFRSLLDALHARDMRYVLDMVVNHAGYNASIVSARPDWFHSDEDCEAGPEEIVCRLSGLPDFAQEKPEVAAYLTELSASWARGYAIDGIRMDTAKHVPRSFFAERWLPAMRDEVDDLFVIAEVFDEGNPSVFGPYLDAGFDSAFHFPLRRALIEVIGQGQSTDRIGDAVHATQTALGEDATLDMVTFLANHDVPRFSEEIELGAPAARRDRYLLALAALFTLPGIPQLYMGDELGLMGEWPVNRDSMPSWSWSQGQRSGAHPEALGDAGQTYARIAKLARLRSENTALWSGRFAEVWRQGGGEPVYGFLRLAAGDRALVFLNTGEDQVSLRVPITDNPGLEAADRAALGDGAMLSEALGSGAPAEVVIRDGHLELSLPPLSASVYLQ